MESSTHIYRRAVVATTAELKLHGRDHMIFMAEITNVMSTSSFLIISLQCDFLIELKAFKQFYSSRASR